MGSRAANSLQRLEARQALIMLLPTVVIVLSVITLPLLANFWISVKPVTLGDLRAPEVVVRERVKAQDDGSLAVEYRLRNSSKKAQLADISVWDALPAGLGVVEVDPACSAGDGKVSCALAQMGEGERLTLRMSLKGAPSQVEGMLAALKDSKPGSESSSDPIMFNTTFTAGNFAKLFDADEFWGVIKVTLIYTVFGTAGALFLGLLAALWLQSPFRGRAVWRGLMLFPYVAPVIAVAFTWLVLFDPFSGAFNALLVRSEVVGEPINFFGLRALDFEFLGMSLEFPLALASVIAFECWRYFPLAFLFILARMQSLNPDLDDAADMDGATPLQKFWYIIMPQLAGIMSVMFLLRFIWTFNKFDDIFLLTGGASGTRTLVVNVYEQAFAISNIGAGAAAATVVFFVLLLCCAIYFRFAPKGEGW